MEFKQSKELDYLDTKIGKFNKDSSVFTIYISNLSYEKVENDIKELFEAFGHVNYVKLIKDQATHLSKGIAFVQMPNQKHAKLAIAKLNNSQLDNRTIKVSIAKENNKNRLGIKKIRRKPYKAYISKKERELAADIKSV